MLSAKGCTLRVYEGETLPRLRYGQETRFGRSIDEQERCHDCGAQKGHLHHLGCDREECPQCHRQAIRCLCSDDKEEETDDE